MPQHGPAAAAGVEAYLLLFEHSDTMVCTLDLEGRFTSLNRAGERLTGWAAEDLAGRLALDVIAPEERERSRAQFVERLAGRAEPGPQASLLLTRDGRRVPIEVTSEVFTEHGRPAGVVGLVRDVTDLELANERFRSFFESAPIGEAIVAPDGRFLEVNEALCRLVGYPRPELVGRRFQEITHPDEAARDAELSADLLAGRIETIRQEKRYVRRDGSVVWGLLNVSLVRDGDGAPQYFASQIQDITERKETEHRLAEAERRYRTLVEQLPLATYVRPLDLEQPNVYVSPQVEPMLGYPAAWWESRADLLAEIVHPDDRDHVLGDAAQVRTTGEPTEREYRYVKPDGDVVWVQDFTHAVEGDDGAPLYVQGFLLDITGRKRAEAERDRLRDQLIDAQKLEAVGRLAGGVAHNFNNMLTGIKGYAELLLGALAADDPLRHDAEQISRAVEQASALPRQLLAFSRDQPLEQRPVDANVVVEEAADLLRRLVPESVALRCIAGARPATVRTGAGQLEQVLLNLVLNARDAIDATGSITISTRTARLTPETAAAHEVPPGDYVVLSVADTGQGMDAETRAHAFEPFFTTKPLGQGSGLGLASVFAVVKQAGGFIRLETEPGAGATFELHLPCVEPAAGPSAVPREAEGGRMPTVLLAEDEALVRDLLVRALERASFRVVAARNGTEALVLLEREPVVDVLVTDMVMPELGGRELAERVLERRPGLPILFMSGYTTEVPPTAGDGALGQSFIAKPFTPDELVKRIEQAVAQAA